MSGKPFRARPRKSTSPAAERNRNWYLRNYVRLRTQMRARKYGLSMEQLEALFARAAGRCECCGEELPPESSCVDHDHASGVVRGIICQSCNVLDGLMGEQSWRVAAVEKYLARLAVTP